VGGACIDTAIDPGLSSRSSDIVQALHAWTSLPCGQLCFSEPRALTESSVNDPPASASCGRGLRFASAGAKQAALDYQIVGDIVAIVYVAPADPAAKVMNRVGQVLLDPLSPDAVLVDSRGHITSDATAQFCALYGPKATCP
jgi:hypothetical protein